MSDGRRDPDAIEREIERTREALRETLAALDRQFSAERIVDRAAELLRGGGERAAEMALHTLRERPMAAGMIAGGLALLAAGGIRGASPRRAPNRPRDRSPDRSADQGPAQADYDPRIRPTSPGLAGSGGPPMENFDERMAAADRAAARSTGKGDTEMSDPAIHPRDTGPHDTGGSAGRQDMRSRMQHSMRTLRDNLGQGLEHLPEAARRRVVSARLAAVDAQASVERQVRHGTDLARRNAREHPLVLGMVAIGIGAAIGAALPRTSAENHALGAHRDRLLDEADRVFREEMGKVRRVAEAAVEEGRSAVKDTLESGPPTEDDPARRVADAAKSEAERQKVGSMR
jgi:ElaB/YqjD/DUF883 family membrane-anchored ribosome-binding protein